MTTPPLLSPHFSESTACLGPKIDATPFDPALLKEESYIGQGFSSVVSSLFEMLISTFHSEESETHEAAISHFWIELLTPLTTAWHPVPLKKLIQAIVRYEHPSASSSFINFIKGSLNEFIQKESARLLNPSELFIAQSFWKKEWDNIIGFFRESDQDDFMKQYWMIAELETSKLLGLSKNQFLEQLSTLESFQNLDAFPLKKTVEFLTHQLDPHTPYSGLFSRQFPILNAFYNKVYNRTISLDYIPIILIPHLFPRYGSQTQIPLQAPISHTSLFSVKNAMQQLRGLSDLSFKQVMEKSEPIWNEVFKNYRDLESEQEGVEFIKSLCLSVSAIKDFPYLMSLFILKLQSEKLPLSVFSSDPYVQKLLPQFFLLSLDLDPKEFPSDCSNELLEFILIYFAARGCLNPHINIPKDVCLKFIRERDSQKKIVSDKMAKKLSKYLSTPQTLGALCSQYERDSIHSHWPLLAAFQHYFSEDPHFVSKERVAFQPILLNFWIRYTHSKSDDSLFKEFLNALLVPFSSQEKPPVQPALKRRKINLNPPAVVSAPTIFSSIAGLNHSLTSLQNYLETNTLLNQLYRIETVHVHSQAPKIELYSAFKKFFSALSYDSAKKQSSLTEIYNQLLNSNSILSTAFLEFMIGQTNRELGWVAFRFDEDLTTSFWQENWTELREVMDFKALQSLPNDVEKQIRWIANFETLGDRDKIDELEKLFSQSTIKCNQYDKDSLEKLLIKDQTITPNLDQSQARIIFAFYCLKHGISINRLPQKSWLWARINQTSIDNLFKTSDL